MKELADTEILSEAANTELEKNNLEQAQLMFTQLLKKYDSIIAPPYPVNIKVLDGHTATTNISMLSGLLQDPAEYLEMYLDEVWKQIDHGRCEKTCHSS